CQQHRQPPAAAVDVFREVEHPRRKIYQQRDEAQKEKSPGKIQRAGWPRQIREGQQVPDDLEENHVQKYADVAQRFTLRIAQELAARRFLRRREVAINQKRLHDRADQSGNDKWNKTRAVVQQFLAEKKSSQACQNRRNQNEVQTKVEDGIEQTACERRFRIDGSSFIFQTAVKVPTLQHCARDWQHPHAETRKRQRKLGQRFTSISKMKQFDEVPRQPPHQKQI